MKVTKKTTIDASSQPDDAGISTEGNAIELKDGRLLFKSVFYNMHDGGSPLRR